MLYLLSTNALKVKGSLPVLSYDKQGDVRMRIHAAVASLHNLGYQVPAAMEFSQLLDSAGAVKSAQRANELTIKREWWEACIRQLHSEGAITGVDLEGLCLLLDPELAESLPCSPDPDTADSNASETDTHS
jgi:hypothetical protein